MADASRGYGKEHVAERRRWEPIVKAGGVLCARCMLLIGADEPWDLGHDDHDRSLYVGPEHVRCNRRAGGRKGARVSARARRIHVWSRHWLAD